MTVVSPSPASLFLDVPRKPPPPLSRARPTSTGGMSAARHRSQRRPRVLLAATGSVATVKIPELALRLSLVAGAEVKVALTKAARHFWECAKVYNPAAWASFQELGGRVEVLEDKNEWDAWNAMGDPVLHIQLRDWADLLLIAPLSANTLGKLAHGLCDNLVTSIVRAWDVKRKPVLLAPAMNTHMWEHPFTAQQLRMLQTDLHYAVIPPVSKLLACGDRGQGGLAAIEDLVRAVQDQLQAYLGRDASGDGREGST